MKALKCHLTEVMDWRSVAVWWLFLFPVSSLRKVWQKRKCTVKNGYLTISHGTVSQLSVDKLHIYSFFFPSLYLCIPLSHLPKADRFLSLFTLCLGDWSVSWVMLQDCSVSFCLEFSHFSQKKEKKETEPHLLLEHAEAWLCVTSLCRQILDRELQKE